MNELEEQAKKLMATRVREVRDEYGMSRSKTYDLEVKEHVARMDRILHSRHSVSHTQNLSSS